MWLDRYERFIENCKSRCLPVGIYTENHHIKPECMGGPDEPSNVVKLKLREHFIAHYMLSKAYPKHLGLVYAFVKMCERNKQKCVAYDTEGKLYFNSRMYEDAKTNLYNMLSEKNTGMVYVKNKAGETLHITCEEYRSNRDIFDSVNPSDIVRVRNKEGTLVEMTSEEYKLSSEDYKFHTTGMVSCVDIDGKKCYLTKDEYASGDYFPHENTQNRIVIVTNRLTGESFNIGMKDWRSDPRCTEVYRLKLRDKLLYFISSCVPSNVIGKPNTFIAFDTTEQKYVHVHKHDYNKDPDRYNTTSKGRKVVRLSEGKFGVVDKDCTDFPGVTKGYTTVRMISTQKTVKVSVQEFEENAHLYEGCNKGKRNVRSIHQIGYYQISREQEDHEVGPGPKRGIRVVNIHTNQMKLISTEDCVDYNWKVYRDDPDPRMELNYYYGHVCYGKLAEASKTLGVRTNELIKLCCVDVDKVYKTDRKLVKKGKTPRQCGFYTESGNE